MLRRSPYLLQPATAGTSVSDLSIRFSRPGNGITPPDWEQLLVRGAHLKLDLCTDQVLLPEHFS